MNEQYKRLQEDYKTFRLEVVTKENERGRLLVELKEEDKCPFCNRLGESINKDKNNDADHDKKDNISRSLTVPYPNKDSLNKIDRSLTISNPNKDSINKIDNIDNKESDDMIVKNELKIDIKDNDIIKEEIEIIPKEVNN